MQLNRASLILSRLGIEPQTPRALSNRPFPALMAMRRSGDDYYGHRICTNFPTARTIRSSQSGD